jgi:hypothetical protein
LVSKNQRSAVIELIPTPSLAAAIDGAFVRDLQQSLQRRQPTAEGPEGAFVVRDAVYRVEGWIEGLGDGAIAVVDGPADGDGGGTVVVD